jgi:anion-transporting  ArsA/GET3 family ATPase
VTAGSPLDEVLGSSSVVLVVGPGGVGKTTMSAALAARAAASGDRQVLLITVDPARRLADALGQGLTSEPVLVPTGPGPGRLWAVMVDMARGWDALVGACAPAPADAQALAANPLYRALTTRFAQSHDFIALDQLAGHHERPYDLVVVDTPPSAHAIDILDAPERMVAFFDSALLRWLTAPYRTRLAAVAARPFLALAERLLGGPFLAQVGELFWLLSRLQPGLVARARTVQERLAAPDTSYVVATTAEPLTLSQTGELVDALVQRGRWPDLIVHNRAPRPVDASVVGSVADPTLREAMAALAGSGDRLVRWWNDRFAGASEPEDPPTMPAVVSVPWRAGDLASVGELIDLLP